MKTFETLYARNSNGKINQWKVVAQQMSDGAIVVISEGILGGELTGTSRKSKGKNIGKMNETSAYQQACKDAQSRWENKKKKGYKSLEDLGIIAPVGNNLEDLIENTLPKNRTDANNLSKPMKAQPYFTDKGEVRIKFPCLGQPKLNGFRVFARWEIVKEGEGMFATDVEKVVFRSKEGLKYDALGHIEKDFTKDMFFLSDGTEIVFDGEMYCHGMKLQDIASAVKKKNSNTERIKFYTFDLAIDNLKQKERLKILSTIESDNGMFFEDSPIQIVENIEVRDNSHAQQLTDFWISKGYEGGIFRDPKAVYQFGSRPKTMVKLKRTEDDDFPIVDIVGGENASDVAVFVCKTKEGLQFKINSQGTLEKRKEFLTNKNNYIGKKLQLKFFEWTKDKKPFHIKEVVVRDYE